MKQVGKRLLSLLLALCMMMSLCVSALAVNDVTVTATLDTPTLYRKSVAQTVKLRVATSEPITICDYQVKLKLPEGWTVTAMENDDANAQLVPADYNLATGSVVWNGDGEDHSVTNFVIYTVEIPADTKAGRYELSLYEVEANATYGTKPVLTSPDNNTSATLTIKDDDTSNLYKDYCVAFYTGGGSGQSTLQMGTDKNVVSLEVLIQNGIINKGQTYNAYGITLSYDPTILEFVKVGNVDCIYSVENDKVNGTVTVYRSGTQLSCSARDGFFAEFKGIATGSCNVAITRAYVDKGENANVRNAPSANITTTGYIVNVDGPYYNVTASSPQELVYEPYAKANTAYTFTLANGYDWRGMAIRYTIDNGDGISWPVEYDTTKNCYTIPANWVTGDIHIDVSFRNFDVTVEGNAKNDVTLSSTSKPSYRVDYPFTLNKQEGWTYTVAVTVGGKNANYTVSEDGKTYTIAGKDMSGQSVYWVCIRHSHNASACPITQIPEVQIQQAFLQLYYNLKHQGSHILPDLITNLQPIRERKFLWSVDVIELNKQIAELTSQNQLLTTLRESGCVDPDIFISKSNALTEQLRAAKQAKSRILNQDGDDTITGTQELLTILKRGPETLHDFDGELFGQLIDKVIIESNTSLRFRLKNGLELRESIERTVR